MKEPTRYQLRYKGENVNGVDTRGLDENNRTADNDYRYITNVNCTSKIGSNGGTVANGVVAEDHRNYTGNNGYRLYTLVVTCEGADQNKKGEMINARAYIRYYDANGLHRLFCSIYKKSMYSGCVCSFNQISAMAIKQDEALLEEQQTITDRYEEGGFIKKTGANRRKSDFLFFG